MKPEFKAGFVNLLGKPNAGKSTLMNLLTGEPLSIVTPKAQTTRNRIIGIVNGEGYQVVISDTPGFIVPKYALQKAMMRDVGEALEDADLVILVVDLSDRRINQDLIRMIGKSSSPRLIMLNKADLVNERDAAVAVSSWQSVFPGSELRVISLLGGQGLPKVMDWILRHLPEHPPYYEPDALTDRHERFFVAEMVREKIFLKYAKEIPYAAEVVVDEFREMPELTRIRAIIFVERKSQKPIMIGKDGAALKAVGTEARHDIEKFLGRKVYLELVVKIRENWKNDPKALRQLGYS